MDGVKVGPHVLKPLVMRMRRDGWLVEADYARGTVVVRSRASGFVVFRAVRSRAAEVDRAEEWLIPSTL